MSFSIDKTVSFIASDNSVKNLSTEMAKIGSGGGSTVVDSATNGNLTVNGTEVQVYDDSVLQAAKHTHSNKSTLDLLSDNGTSVFFNGNPIAGGTGGTSTAEKLVAHYVHSGNTQIAFSSIDWTTAIATTTQPHGLAAKTAVLLTPNYIGLDNLNRDILSIPIEWIRSATQISLTPIDATTVKVVRADDTALVVTPTSTENNNNVDITKFHFEVTVGWTISNLPNLKKFRMRIIGYIKSSVNYRYTQFTYKSSDNVTSGITGAFFSTLNTPNIGTGTATHAVWTVSDWTFDITSQAAVLDMTNNFAGRRNGFNNAVIDQITERVKLVGFLAKDTMYGAQSLYSGATYNIPGNGSIIEVYDLGGGA
jgi:hypothetical protein